MHSGLYAALALLALPGCGEFARQEQQLADARGALASCQAARAEVSEAGARQDAAIEALRGDMAAIRLATAETAERCAGAGPAAEDATLVAASTAMPEKLIVGRLERVWIEDLQLALPARIDTGAETASLDARNITPFERDGRPWVRFEIPHPDAVEALTLERPRVREALVVQASSTEPERRPVIELGIQLGPVRQLAEFTLSDRSHLDFQMLVGRNILRDVMLVDVSQRNLVPLPTAAVDIASEPAPGPAGSP